MYRSWFTQPCSIAGLIVRTAGSPLTVRSALKKPSIAAVRVAPAAAWVTPSPSASSSTTVTRTTQAPWMVRIWEIRNTPALRSQCRDPNLHSAAKLAPAPSLT
jgi:hypothetical protein